MQIFSDHLYQVNRFLIFWIIGNCRLCLPVTLTTEQRAMVRAYALEIAGHAPALEVT